MADNGKGGAGLTLEVVDGRGGLRDFLALPHRLYAADPAWIAPLNFEQRQRFSPRNHFFDHARWRGWIAYRQGRPVGRITAQVDELHLAQHGDGAGYFGMFEAERDDEVVAALFRAAEAWLPAICYTRALPPRRRVMTSSSAGVGCRYAAPRCPGMARQLKPRDTAPSRICWRTRCARILRHPGS